MKTIINNIKNRITKTLEAVRYHYINYKVDIHHFGIEVINLSERVHDLEKNSKIDDLESTLEDLDCKLQDLSYRIDDVDYKTDDIIVESDIEEMITEKIEELDEYSTFDHKLCVPQTPAQRLTNNILNYYGGDWNAEDFNNCFEIVNKYDIKLKKAVKGGK